MDQLDHYMVRYNRLQQKSPIKTNPHCICSHCEGSIEKGLESCTYCAIKDPEYIPYLPDMS